ncbi:Myotubularin- protein 14 [Mortierella alpina]|nr:Myotubularin- protein 14 [Mortierella alpina]
MDSCDIGSPAHQPTLDQSIMGNCGDQSFDLGESGMMSFQDIKSELDMIRSPPQNSHQRASLDFDAEQSRRHMLPFPFRIPRPEKKLNVAIKEFVPSSPTSQSRKAQEPAPSDADKDKVNDTHELSRQFEKSHFARVRARFVVPCILVRGKNICRSATLSNEVEVFMHSVNQKINDLNQKRKMFLYGTGEKSPDKEDRESSLERQRLEDIELLHQLGVTYINDLMVENRKVKYGLKVTSSEKVDSFGRYSKFKLVATPYPGVEFFQKFKANKYSARKLCFDWSQNFADAELQLPQGYFDNLGIRWRDYKSWDLIELTRNYLRLYLTHVADDTHDDDPSTAIKNAMGATARSPKGLLIHCISGMDIVLVNNGEAHQSLTAAEMLYLTMGYDWFLFNHLLADRSQRGEDIFYFCFYFLKFIYGEEFSLKSISEVNKKSKSVGRPSAYQTASHSPLLKDIGRLRSMDNASTSPELIDTNGFICEECRVSRKTPTDSVGRVASAARNNSQDAASSTDGKPSSWQLVTFSTPPGHRQGSPRIPFLPTLQTMSKGSGSPRGNKRSSLSSGFMEQLEEPDTEAQTSASEQRSSATSPFGLADGRFRLGVPQINARRSSSSNIPELFGADSKPSPTSVNAGIEFVRVDPSPDSLSARHVAEHEKGGREDGKGDSTADKPQTPRKRASTFDGGLLLSLAQDSHPEAENRDAKEPEEDLTSSDDDNDDLGGPKDGRHRPPPTATSSKAGSPQICQVCHHSFRSESRQPNVRSAVKPLSGAFTPTEKRPSVTPDQVDTPLNAVSQQQPMNISAKQALERMRNVDRIFAQDDGEPFFDGCHHRPHHHHTADPHINESDREEGMFQLEIEDHRSSYRHGHFSMYEKRAGESHCLSKMHSSDPGCHDDSLNSSICAEQDLGARSGMLAPANETESIDGENESFWEETSTVDYGCSPGSILNGFGLGLTKCHTEEEDLSLIMDGSLGSHADGSLQNEEEEEEDDDDDDDDDDDGAASLNSRQSSLKMDHHENEHLFMPSLKGVFSHTHRFSHGGDGRKEQSSVESFQPKEGRRSSSSTGASSANILTGMAAAGSTKKDSSEGASTPVPRILTRKQKLRQLRRLFMEIRDEIGDGSLAPTQPAEGVNIMNPASSSVEDDDCGSTFNRESFSDDPSFQYRSPIATAAAFASRHGQSTASSTSGQSLFGLGGPTRHFGGTAAVSPPARTRQTHPQPHQRQQPAGPGIQPSSGRKSPFEWAAAAAASISSSASGMVSGGVTTRQSPSLVPSSDYAHPRQHRKTLSLSQPQPQPQSQSQPQPSSPPESSNPFVLPPAHYYYRHSQEQNAQQRGAGGNGSFYGEASHIISPGSGASIAIPAEASFGDITTSSTTNTSTTLYSSSSSARGEMLGYHGMDGLRRQSLVSSTTSSASNASSRLRGGPSTSTSHMKEKGAENTGRWDCPSPERYHDRRGPPKDWDAPEAEEGEISHYSGRRGAGGSSSGRGRDRDRDRRDYRDRDRERGGGERGGSGIPGDSRRRDDRHRDGDRDYRDGDRDYRDRAGRSDRDRDGRNRRSSRSRSPYRRGGRSRSRSPRGGRRGHKDDMDVEEGEYRRRKGDSDSEDDRDGRKDRHRTSKKDSVDAEKPLEELSPEDEEARMMALMGFGGFDSTKGKKVAGADVSGADIKKQRQYRQYMNRRGGFNRPLDAK